MILSSSVRGRFRLAVLDLGLSVSSELTDELPVVPASESLIEAHVRRVRIRRIQVRVVKVNVLTDEHDSAVAHQKVPAPFVLAAETTFAVGIAAGVQSRIVQFHVHKSHVLSIPDIPIAIVVPHADPDAREAIPVTFPDEKRIAGSVGKVTKSHAAVAPE